MAQLAAQDVPRLKLKWTFGFPGASCALAQPTAMDGRIFIGSQSGKVYSLDASTGCTYWELGPMLYLIVPLAVLIGVIWGLVVSRSFRVVVLILVALGAVFYFSASERAAQEQKQEATKNARDEEQQRITFETEQKEYCQAERKRWSIVLPPQIEIRNQTFTQKNQLYGFSTLTQKQPYDEDYTFTASGKNNQNQK